MWESVDIPWQAAFRQGWDAFQRGSIPIGASIADENGAVISLGRNRTRDHNLNNPKIAHAETEALQSLNIAKYPHTENYTLYACMEPCPMCMGTIVMSDIRLLRVAARDNYCGVVSHSLENPYIASKK